jgi:hypothetical protein
MKARTIVVASALLMLVSACVHLGTGDGVLVAPQNPGVAQASRGAAQFTYRVRYQNIQGDLDARLPDGRMFTGRFLQMTVISRHDAWPFWTCCWSSTWSRWWGPHAYGYQGPIANSTTYLDKLIAELRGPQDSTMRCQFVLREPMRGIRSGGMGECRLSTQEQVLAVELPKT